MKTSILNTLIITAALSAVAGFAQAAPSSQYHDAGANTVSNTSRDAVRAEYLNAVKTGTLVKLGGQDTFAKVAANNNLSTKSRTDVKSELRMAQAMPARGEAAFAF